MNYKLVIHGRLSGINELINADRRSPYEGARMKREAETLIRYTIRQQLHGLHIKKPVALRYAFYEPNRMRDPDNISGFAHKVVQDSLVKEKVLKDDGWDEIVGMGDTFYVDKEAPRIVVHIEEVE